MTRICVDCQEVHVVGANPAGLAFAVRLAENMPAGGGATVYVWDGRLQRSGLRKRRLAVLSHENEAVSQVGRPISTDSDQLCRGQMLPAPKCRSSASWPGERSYLYAGGQPEQQRVVCKPVL